MHPNLGRMDKNSIIGYVLIFLIFVGWLFYSNQQKDAFNAEQQRVQDSIATSPAYLDSIAKASQFVENNPNKDTSASVQNNIAAAVDATFADADTAKKENAQPEVVYTLGNKDITVQVSSKGGRIAQVQLNNYKRFDSTDLILFNSDQSQFNYTIPLSSGLLQSADLDFEVLRIDSFEIDLIHRFAEGGSMVQKYKLNNRFLVDYEVEFDGLNGASGIKSSSIPLDWRVNAPLQERSLEDERIVSTVYFKYKGESGVDYLSERGDDEKTLTTNVHWVSFKQKFFMSSIIFPEGLTESGTSISIKDPQNDAFVESMAASFAIPYDRKDKTSQNFQFYYGPNHYQTLQKVDVSLEKTISLGWGIIGWVNKYLIIPVFNWLSNYFSSYGLIILLLTLIIKLALIGPMYKIYKSSAKMKLLKPELDEIKAKTDGDMAKAQQEQMKLYKKAGVSPFGGCLPQLIQFPILIAMFRFFPASIELRQQSFLWAKDLSTYDSVFDFPNGIDIWAYGDHISLFTILMALSSLLYTMYNSQSTGLTGSMKYIMYLMPVMLLFWFNSYASGLSYYYFLANIITFGQNFIFKKFIVDEDKLHKQIQEHKKKKVTNKKSGFQKRLEDMAKKQQQAKNAKKGK
ncbi:MAG: YidC/Oxa1 family membrane protein insertase [Bacteroidia bacterium]